MSLEAFSSTPDGGQQANGQPFEALVQGGKDNKWLVMGERGVLKASQAYSCLVQPALGDRVLIQPLAGHYYLLAILERQQALPLRIQAREGLEVDLGGQDCKWQHAGHWSLQADKASLLSRETEVTTETARIRGQQLTQHWQQVRNLVQDFWHTGQRTWKQVKQAISRVEEVEQKNSGEYLHRVENSMTQHSKRGSITSEKDLRIDAERIHMG
ncbi:DUF3540 domain-containing protein [Marinospirillum sp.]|uniref:DUF3540 domain-containing protein n=1 Tax=Marinospirillum sp. TaxID=2183934 RepID=UPI00384CACD8